MKSTIIVRPSERIAVREGKLSYEEIKNSGIAPGFAASPDVACNCDFIVVLKDDGSEAFIANIESTTRSTLPSRKTRSDIKFGRVRVLLSDQIPMAVLNINWTSNNVRYSDWTP